MLTDERLMHQAMFYKTNEVAIRPLAPHKMY